MEGQSRKSMALILIVMILVQGSYAHKNDKNCDCTKGTKGYTAAAVGGMGLLAGVTYGIAALGFGPIGIAAHSVASGLMSAAATYGVGGAAVAAAQSAGAAGLAVGTKAAIVGAGAAAGYAASGGSDCEC